MVETKDSRPIIFWDLDRTLLDTGRLLTSYMLDLVNQKYEGNYSEEEFIQIYKSCTIGDTGSIDTYKFCVDLTGVDRESDKAISLRREMFLEAPEMTRFLFDGAVDILRSYKDSYIQIVVTQGDQDIQEYKLRQTGIATLVDDAKVTENKISFYRDYFAHNTGNFDGIKIVVVDDKKEIIKAVEDLIRGTLWESHVQCMLIRYGEEKTEPDERYRYKVVTKYEELDTEIHEFTREGKPTHVEGKSTLPRS